MENSITILKLDDINNLTDVRTKLLSHHNMDALPTNQSIVWPEEDLLRKRWSPTEHNSDFLINNISTGLDSSLNYIYTNVLIERAKTKTMKPNGQEFLDRVDRINVFETSVLFFEMNNQVYAAVYFNYTNSTKYRFNYLIKDLLIKDIWGEITIFPDDFRISDDNFYWIINKFLYDNKLIDSELSLKIENFTGYTTELSETEHYWKGNGQRIPAFLSTLAIIFSEESDFTVLRMHLSLKNTAETEVNNLTDTNIVFELSKYGSVKTEDYSGSVFNELNSLTEEKIVVTLLLYTAIIPKLISSYINSTQSSQWGQDQREVLLKQVGANMIEKINEKINGDHIQKKSS